MEFIFLLIALAYIIDNLHGRNKRENRNLTSDSMDDQYLKAWFVLEAAEHGYFSPDGDRIFQELDQTQSSIGHEPFEYYQEPDDCQEEYDPFLDHWGPV